MIISQYKLMRKALMEENRKIELTSEQRKVLIGEIKSFFLDNREEEIGDLQAEMLADFLIEKVGNAIYNQALHDALTFFKSHLDDMETDFYTLEKK